MFNVSKNVAINSLGNMCLDLTRLYYISLNRSSLVRTRLD